MGAAAFCYACEGRLVHFSFRGTVPFPLIYLFTVKIGHSDGEALI
eukprot:NODE_3643_length_646_cov_170.959799_g2596_i1.p4 GENE.NODE_3643_length_646_cov_170.959799_g2596_i1~~NODE_3643_length_646_cov_170.959799_g2596_i1.p4  ORF type:complete len:52 (-),score=10.05 NODE_3643_length_646_cov_170.959799_g2596_i1:489-623(-)